MNNESHLLYHEQCPNCKKIGNDTAGDNLGVFSDGHVFCFACGYRKLGNKITAFKAKNEHKERMSHEVHLPFDVSNDLPTIAKQWLEKYEFNHNTLVSNHVLWSDSKQQLIFPYFINGVLVAWQGRCFGIEESKKRKWFSQGKLDSFLYTKGKPSSSIVLVESIVSAIKVSRFTQASPIFGSVLNTSRWLALSHTVDRVILWLDPDKRKEATTQAKEGRLYVPEVSVMFSNKKPKEYSYLELEELCQQPPLTLIKPD